MMVKQGDVLKAMKVNSRTFLKWRVPSEKRGNAKYYRLEDLINGFHQYQLAQFENQADKHQEQGSNNLPDDDLLKQTDILKALNLNYRTFVKWGVPHARKQGNAKYYKLADIVNGYYRYQVSQIITTDDDGELIDKNREEALNIRETRIGRQLKNGILLKEYAPVDALEYVLGGVVSNLDAILTSLPLNIKRNNPDISATVTTLIEKEIVKAQNHMAKIEPDWNGS